MNSGKEVKTFQMTTMKRLSMFVAILLFLLCSQVLAAVDVRFLETKFSRGTGEPITGRTSFQATEGPAMLQIVNGSSTDSAAKNVSSATIKLNGVVLFGPSVFNQNVSMLTKEIILNRGENVIEAVLNGKPNGMLNIKITRTIDAEAGNFIGQDGGTVEVTNPHSVLFGTKIVVPAGTFPNGTILSIGAANVPGTALPDDFEVDGAFISFQSTDPFYGHVYIYMPYTATREENDIRAGFTFNETSQQWEQITPLPTTDPQVFKALVTHFSIYAKVKAKLLHTEVMTDFKIGNDTLQYHNNGQYSCEYNDPDNPGICAGLGLVAAEYYNSWLNNTALSSEKESLMCRWSVEGAAKASCETFGRYLAVHKPSTYGGLFELIEFKIFGDLLQSGTTNDYSYILDTIKANAKKNKVTPLFMFRKRDDGSTVGHAVVAYGVRRTGLTTGEIKIYNVNSNNREETIIYSILPDLNRSLKTFLTYLAPNNVIWEKFALDPIISKVDVSGVISDNPSQHVCSVPVVTTLDAVDIKKTSAVLAGKIDPNYYETDFWFEYGIASNLELFTSTTIGHITNTTAQAQAETEVTTLQPATNYYYRAVAMNEKGTVKGDIKSFTTASNQPIFSASRQLTTSGDNYHPTWSPDGSRIAYASTASGPLNLWSMKVDGTDASRLTNMPNGRSAWGPVYRPGTNEIYYIDNSPWGADYWWVNKTLDDGSMARIQIQFIPGGHNFTSPRFSPDGSKYSYQHYTPYASYKYSIETADFNGTNVRGIKYGFDLAAGDNRNTAWGRGASSNKILFRKLVDGVYSLFSINSDGTNEVRLTPASFSNCTDGEWAPDGNHIIFKGNLNQIYILNLLDNSVQQVTNDSFNNSGPVISPDGSQIAYTSMRDGRSHIFVIQVQ